MTIESGRVLNDRYRLVRPVGQGSQASVWVADHLALSTQVAVKLIDPELAKKEDARERFRREATAAAQLRSAHVVQILDHGIDETQPFIVMELLDGEDLFERLQKRVRLSLQETSKVVTQVARALTRAHAAGIVHRDLKPENVFLIPNEDEEIVKVLDFGVAKVIDPAKRTMQRTGVGTLIGTPHYMSPEQVKGITEVDYRSDLWSLGVIAFQCVTGEMPFDSEGVGDLLIKITIGEAPVPSRRMPSLPASFDAWFAQACHRDPKKRFASARDQAEALARAVGLTPEAGESTRYRFGGLVKRLTGSVRPEAPDAKPRRPTPPVLLVSRAAKTESARIEEAVDLEDVTDIDEAAPVAPRMALDDGTDIDVEESLSSRPPGPGQRAGLTPLPRPAKAAQLPRDLLESQPGEIGSALREVSARSFPRTTVSGLASPGFASVQPPPELDGSRRRRLAGIFALTAVAVAAIIGWRVARPYLDTPAAAGEAPTDSHVAMPRTDPTGPSVTSIDPGTAVDPGTKADAGVTARPAGSSASSAAARGRRSRGAGSSDPAVIEYDTPPPEEDDKGVKPEKAAPKAPVDHGREP